MPPSLSAGVLLLASRRLPGATPSEKTFYSFTILLMYSKQVNQKSIQSGRFSPTFSRSGATVPSRYPRSLPRKRSLVEEDKCCPRFG
jgi:hypothetical protein